MRTTKDSTPNPRPLCVSVSLYHIPQPAKARQTTPCHRKTQNEPTAPQKATPRHSPGLPRKTKPPAITTVACYKKLRYNLLQLFKTHSVRTRSNRNHFGNC